MLPCQHTVYRPPGDITSDWYFDTTSPQETTRDYGSIDDVRRLAAGVKNDIDNVEGTTNGFLQKASYPRSFLVHHEIQRAVTAEVRAGWDPVRG